MNPDNLILQEKPTHIPGANTEHPSGITLLEKPISQQEIIFFEGLNDKGQGKTVFLADATVYTPNLSEEPTPLSSVDDIRK